jgi:hypothetical protein
MSLSSPILNDSKHDPEQVKLMAEECILVNEDDVARGKATKTFCKSVVILPSLPLFAFG